MNRTNPPSRLGLDGLEIINLSLLLSFPVNGLDQFLRTPPGQLSAQPLLQAQHWVTDSLMMLPLFAFGIWAADRIANRAGLRSQGRSAAFKRALVIVLVVAVVQIPVWFERNKKDTLAQAQALVTPHSHGSDDVYWVGSAVILALVCACLVPAAAWAGRGIARAIRPRRGAAAFTRRSAPVLLMAAAPVLAWLLRRAAEHAYASQVDYTGALLFVRVHSHAFFGGGHAPLAGAPVTAAPFAFAYQIAHAFQDGLAGQAAGLPAASMALLRKARSAET